MLEHFIITRFSYPDPRAPDWARRSTRRVTAPHKTIRGGFWSHMPLDLLEPANLEHRFRMFEISCLPSMLAQTDQDFTWVLVVDRDLPRTYRDKLARLISARKKNLVIEFEPANDIRYLTWLEPYLARRPEYVATTLLDDDDVLFRDFVAYIKDQVRETKDIQPVKIFGSFEALQWDLFTSRAAPLGYIKRWSRRVRTAAGARRFPVASGFTLLCKYPEYQYTVLRLVHAWGEFYFRNHSETEGVTPAAVQDFRAELARDADRNGDRAERWNNADGFHAIAGDGPHVVLINHFMNVELERLFEHPRDRTPVTETAFPQSLAVDMVAAGKYARFYDRSWMHYWEVLRTQIRSIPPSPWRALKIVRRAMLLAVGFLRLR